MKATTRSSSLFWAILCTYTNRMSAYSLDVSLSRVMLLVFSMLFAGVSTAQIYSHSFGTTSISAHPYSVAPSTLNSNLNTSSWSNNATTWASETGASGVSPDQALQMPVVNTGAQMTLSMNVASTYLASVSGFSFWGKSGVNGPTGWSMTINGISVGSGTLTPGAAGASTGNLTVTNAVNNQSSILTVIISLTGGSGGTFAIDNFVLNGSVCLPTPTVSISSSTPGPICPGTSVTFTPALTNGGTGTFQWKLNGSNISTSNPYTTTTLPVGNNTIVLDYTRTDAGCGATVTSNTVNLTVNAQTTPTVNISTVSPGSTFCAGTSVTFTATAANAGTTPLYQWRVNGTNVGSNTTSNTFTSTTLNNNDQVSVVVTSNDPCPTVATATSAAVTVTVNPVLTPSVAVTNVTPSTTVCAGTPVTVTVTPTNGGATPTYQWRINGVNTGAPTSSNTFTSSTLNNNDQVSVVMTSSYVCPSTPTATAVPVIITVNPNVTASATISASKTSICPAESVTFSSVVVNGGASPVYQWKLNGTNVGTNSPTYTNASLSNGDVVTMEVTSSNACASPKPALANNISMTVNPNLPVSVSISASATSICPGSSVTFTATPTNGGSSPSYQWRLNGVNVGTNSPTYTSATLNNNDVVSVVMTSNATPCAVGSPATSNNITITVNPTIPVSVSIGSSNTTICPGNTVTFTATPVNGGSTPSFQWRVNGSNAGTNSPTFSTTTLANGDVVSVVLTTSLGTSPTLPCAVGSPAASNSIATTVRPLSAITLSSAFGTDNQTVCINSPISPIQYTLGGSATSASITGGSLPAGVTGNFNSGIFTISGTPTVSGTFNYTITATGICNNATISGTITVRANSTLVLNSGSTSQSVCINTAISNIVYQYGATATGATVTGLPAGVSASVSGGLVTISGTPTVSGTFNYTVTTTGPCVNASLTGSITSRPNVVPSVTATAVTAMNGVGGWCNGAPITLTANPTNAGTTPTYQWQLLNSSSVWVNIPGQTAKNISITPATGYNQYRVITTASADGCSIPSSATSAAFGLEYSTAKPANTRNNDISGSASVCPAAYGVIYSCNAITDAATYVWTFPKGFEIVSANSAIIRQTTDAAGVTTLEVARPAAASQITVNVNGTAPINTTQSITAYASNPCGDGGAGIFSVNIGSFAAVNIGADTSVCSGSSISLSAIRQGVTASVTWSVQSGTGSFSNTLIDNPTFTPTTTSGPVVLRATTNDPSGSCPATFDELTLTVKALPTVTISGSTTICSGTSANLTLNTRPNTTITYNINGGSNQTYSVGGTGTALTNFTFPTPALGVTSNFNLVNVFYTAAPACTQAASGTATVSVNPAAVVNAGPDQSICSNTTATMAATFSGGATGGTWTTTGTGSFSNNNSATAVYTPSPADISAGSVNLIFSSTGQSSPCTVVRDTMILNIFQAATVSVGSNRTICSSGTAIMTASYGGGATSATWTTSGTGTFSNQSPTAVYTPSAADINPTSPTNITLTYTTNDPVGPCGAVSSSFVLTINPAATVSAGTSTAACSNTNINMAGSFGGGASGATWSTSGSGSFSSNNTNAVYTPSAADISAGSVTISYTSTGQLAPCTPQVGTMVLTIGNAATVSAGAAQSICSSSAAVMAGSFGGGASSATWSTSGTGTFNNQTPGAIYTPSSADISAGSVTLTYTTNDPPGVCGAATSSMVLTIFPAVTISAGTNQTVCSSSPITLAGSVSGGASTATWTTSGSGSFSNSALPNAVYTPSGADIAAGTVTLTFTSPDPAGPCAAQSAQMVATIRQLPQITNQPSNAGVCAGNNGTLTVGAIGSGLTYQWYKQGGTLVNNGATGTGAIISGATSSSLTVSYASLAEGGNYYVVVSGSSPCTAATSSMAAINVDQVINITTQPASQTVCLGTGVTFNIAANANGATLSYQWRKNGTAIGSATGTSFTINPVAVSDAANYDVVISGVGSYSCPNTNSAPGVLAVNLPSSITLGTAAGTANQTVCVNTPITNIAYNMGGGATSISVTGGSLPAGVSGSFASGIFTISGTPTVAGTFNYTVTATGPCTNSALNGTITVSPIGTITLSSAAPTANQTVCQNVAITPITYATGGSATGATISAGSLPTGVTAVFSSGTFTISGTPSVSGTFNFTISATGPCANNSTTATITVNPVSTLALTSAAGTANQTICINSTVTNITYLGGGGTTNVTASGLPPGVTGSYNSGTKVFTISGSATTAGTYNYTVTTAGLCANVTMNGTILVEAMPVGGTTNKSGGLFACAGSNGGTISLSGQSGNVSRWENSVDGGVNWNPMASTATSVSFSNITQTTWYRAAVVRGSCTGVTAYSSHTIINVVPISGPAALSATSSPQFICSGSSTLTAVGLGQGTNAGSSLPGGSFDNAGVDLDQPPGWWRAWNQVDGYYNMSANADNTKPNSFNLSNGPKVFAGQTYDNDPLDGMVNNNKFMIVSGIDYVATLETPIFNLIGLTTASLDWYEAYVLTAGASIVIEISTDGGNNYMPTPLKTITGAATYGNPNEGFTKTSLNLSAFVGLSNLRVRFRYTGTTNSSWGLEMANIIKSTAPATYTWNLYDPAPPSGNVADHFLNVFQNPSVVVTPPSPNTTNAPITYNYSLQSSAGGCAANIQVTVNPTPIVLATPPPSICSGGSVSIPISGNVVGTTFTWVRNANPNVTGSGSGSCLSGTCTTISETLTNLTTIPQVVSYTITPFYSNGGVSCPGVPVTINVTVLPPPTATLSAVYDCQSGMATISLNVVGSGTVSGVLMPGNIPVNGTAPGTITLSPIALAATTTYSFQSLSVSGCSLAAMPTPVTVTVPPTGAAGLWVGFYSTDWFNPCNWANRQVPDNSVNVTIPGNAFNFCEINPSSPFAATYGYTARSRNITITNRQLRFTPSGGRESLLNTWGNLTIQNDSALVNMSAGGKIELAGDWINNRTHAGFNEGTGTVELLGGSAYAAVNGTNYVQDVTVNDANGETFFNLIINNSYNFAARNEVTLQSKANVSGVFTLVQGRVLTTQAKLLTIINTSPSAVVGGANPNPYVNGPMARITNQTSNYNFPIGKPNGPYQEYRPAIVQPQAATTITYNSEYFAYTPGTSPYLPYQRVFLGVMNTEIWEIARTPNNTTDYARVGLYYINPNNNSHWTNVQPCSNCNVAIVKRYAEFGNTWYFTSGQSTSTGFNMTLPETRSWSDAFGLIWGKPISSFSPFTFGYDLPIVLGTNTGNQNTITIPLSQKLISFEGELVNTNDAQLTWSVMENKGIDVFELEHSFDGRVFSKVGKVTPGADKQYDYLDRNLGNGTHYYRLALRDKQGNVAYSKSVKLSIGRLYTMIRKLEATVVRNEIVVNVFSAATQKMDARIVTVDGRPVWVARVGLSPGENRAVLNSSYLAQGLYFLQLTTEDGVKSTFKLLRE